MCKEHGPGSLYYTPGRQGNFMEPWIGVDNDSFNFLPTLKPEPSGWVHSCIATKLYECTPRAQPAHNMMIKDGQGKALERIVKVNNGVGNIEKKVKAVTDQLDELVGKFTFVYN